MFLFMNYLAKELKKYYKKEGTKIIFNNKKTLNQLALQMWEYLNFSQIDPGVISRVINGRRLFTSLQLEAFCKLLNINSTGKANLFYCLNKDYGKRYGFDIDIFCLSKSDIIDLLQEMSNKA